MRRRWMQGRMGVASKNLDSGEVFIRLCATMRELAYSQPRPQVMAIDIPIGLTECGPRECDLEARRLLGVGRASSVFPAPIRPVLAAATYPEACRIRQQVEGKKMSKQAWLITPKIREVDALMREDSELRRRAREIHPEVCFYFLAGRRPMTYSKKSKMGQEERRRLLEPNFGQRLREALEQRGKLACAVDDVLDAFAALWTAERIATGLAQTIPTEPPKDTYGLRMEINA